MLQIEFEFQLPCGYLDAQGTLHRRGIMRRATALDEVEPLNHPRVKQNEAYLSILILSRVVMRLGDVAVKPEVIEALFAPDFAYLQDLYLRVNTNTQLIETECPDCGRRFILDLSSAHAH